MVSYAKVKRFRVCWEIGVIEDQHAEIGHKHCKTEDRSAIRGPFEALARALPETSAFFTEVDRPARAASIAVFAVSQDQTTRSWRISLRKCFSTFFVPHLRLSAVAVNSLFRCPIPRRCQRAWLPSPLAGPRACGPALSMSK